MYIQQNTPQITIHLLYRHFTTVSAGGLRYNVLTTEYRTNHKRYNVEVLVLNIS